MKTTKKIFALLISLLMLASATLPAYAKSNLIEQPCQLFNELKADEMYYVRDGEVYKVKKDRIPNLKQAIAKAKSQEVSANPLAAAQLEANNVESLIQQANSTYSWFGKTYEDKECIAADKTERLTPWMRGSGTMSISFTVSISQSGSMNLTFHPILKSRVQAALGYSVSLSESESTTMSFNVEADKFGAVFYTPEMVYVEGKFMTQEYIPGLGMQTYEGALQKFYFPKMTKMKVPDGYYYFEYQE